MVIILALCIPITAIVMGFFTLKGVQLGLRWQVEMKEEKQPSFDVPNPVAPIVEMKQNRDIRQQEKEIDSVFHEWVNGAEERR